MSVRVHAEDNNVGFRFIRENLPADEETDMASAVQKVATMSLDPVSAVATANDLRDNSASDVGSAAHMVGRMVFAEIIDFRMKALAVKTHGQGWVGLWTWEKNLFSKDVHRFVRSPLSVDFPGLLFMRSIKPPLEKANLNKTGVLLGIAYAIAAYDDWLADGQVAKLSIGIKKS